MEAGVAMEMGTGVSEVLFCCVPGLLSLLVEESQLETESPLLTPDTHAAPRTPDPLPSLTFSPRSN